MSDTFAKLPTFRVHFHDDASLDITAADPTIAEAQAKKRRPGNFVKKVKILREARPDASTSSTSGDQP